MVLLPRVKHAGRWFDMADFKSIKDSFEDSNRYRYSYNPQDQTYTQLSAPSIISPSEDSTGDGVISKVASTVNNPYRYSYNTQDQTYTQMSGPGMKKGGKVKMSSASKRADGIATKGKTKGRIV